MRQISGLACIAIALLVSPAEATTTQQKRQQLYPFVTAAIDCIAAAIPRNPRATDFARRKRWLDAALETRPACQPTVTQMERAVDVVLGPGTGKLYVSTYFKKELPGNLAKRVNLPSTEPNYVAKPVATPVAPPAPDTEAEAARKKLLAASFDKQGACIRKAAGDLVPYSAEPADTLASVIMDRCTQFEKEQVDILVATLGAPRDQVEKVAADVTAKTRRRIVGEIVTIRAAAAKSASEREQSGGKKPDEDPAKFGRAL